LYIIENRKASNNDSVEFQHNEESELLAQVKEGLEYHEPEACEDGVNGTYFMKDAEANTIAVFKPNDEEGNSSPKKMKDNETIDRGILDGEGAQREFAAYLLDKDHFAGVPETELVELELNGVNKMGSLQRFVDNDGASWDIGPSKFPIREVHKIGVLDLRLYNTDRHGGNILFKTKEDGTKELIPIDHGLSLPPNFEHAWFEWITWPQAKVPFDKETLDYIDHLDIEHDVQLLRSLGIREECIQTMVISSTLLKKGAAAGLTLFQIATLASRTDLLEPSPLERMIESALQEPHDDKAIWRIMDEEIAQSKNV